MCNPKSFTIYVLSQDSGKRLDVVLASRISSCSRSFLASLIRNGNISVNGKISKPGCKVTTGDQIDVLMPDPEPLTLMPEQKDLDILYEDAHLMVVNKPAELVVHPAPGHCSGTLVNRLLFYYPEIISVGNTLRPGIVHRLDKDTSGSLIVAKKASAFDSLSSQFKKRIVQKKYLALVYGEIKEQSGVISLPIGRHLVDRKKMSTSSRKSRLAETHWQVKERLKGSTLVDIDLKTGRTHQIRVHFSAIGHPVIGDKVYGGRMMQKKRINDLPHISRQMLHALRIGFVHPVTEKFMQFESPVPEDMLRVIKSLRRL
jgi:23S rRNA pseudouridine1911/1915/1917 synthase